MAIYYDLYCPLDRSELEARLATAAQDAGEHWQAAWTGEMTPIKFEVLAEHGFTGNFKSYAYVRLDKDLGVPARRKLKLFFRDLPEPKVVLFDGDMMDQDAFRRIPPEGEE